MSSTPKIQLMALSLALGAAFAGQAVARAANTANPSASKIAIISIQDAIVATNEGKKEFDALQTKFNPRKAELESQNSEVENLKKQFDAQKEKLSPEASATQVKAIEVKQKTLQRNYEDAQTEFQQAEQEVVNRIGSKMLTVLEKYAKDNGLAMVLDVSNPQTPVLWFDEASNITKQVVEAYNTANPATAPASKGNAAPPAARPPATRANTPSPTPKKP